MSLAERLGMTLTELGERMSSAEYLLWIAEENLRIRDRERAAQKRNR